MKKIIAATAVLAALGMVQQAVAADGTIRFTGEIVNAPCVIGDSSRSQTVDIGQVKVSDFGSTAGTPAPRAKPFQITLEECDLTGGLTLANVTFSGVGATGNPQLLSLDGSAGSAQGVGIQLTDASSVVIPLNVAGSDITLTPGQNTLNFTARYVSTLAAVVPGTANGNLEFNFAYK